MTSTTFVSLNIGINKSGDGSARKRSRNTESAFSLPTVAENRHLTSANHFQPNFPPISAVPDNFAVDVDVRCLACSKLTADRASFQISAQVFSAVHWTTRGTCPRSASTRLYSVD